MQIPLRLTDLQLFTHALDCLDEGWVAKHEVIGLLVGQGDTCIELVWHIIANLESPLRWLSEEVSSFAKDGSRRLIISKEDRDCLLVQLILSLTVFRTISVDVDIRHALSTESADHFVLLQLTSVSIDELGPLVHLMSRFLVELLLVEVIFLLKLLR